MVVVARLARRSPSIILKIFAGLALAILAIVIALLGYSAVHREQSVTLPAPTGPFAVGRTIYNWTDSARPDPLARSPGIPRELQVWIWYPADPSASAAAAPYLPADWVQAIDADNGIGRYFQQDLRTVHDHARIDPPLASQQARYPVVVFEPGYGHIPADYTTVLENLASHGYVVVGIVPTELAPVVAFPNGKVVKRTAAASLPDNAPPAVSDPLDSHLVDVLAADVRFVLDQLQIINAEPGGQFAARLDMHHVAITGHSIGGATAIEVCRTDPRCTAAIDIDGTPYGQSVTRGIERPLLVLQEPAADDTEYAQKIGMVLANSTGPRYQLVIRGTMHFNFSDYAVLFEPGFHVLGALGTIDGARGLDVTNAYLVAFLNHYLKGVKTPLLSGPSPRYPEVRFLSH